MLSRPNKTTKMSGSDTSEVYTDSGSCNKQKTFVTILAKFPVLLKKSQLPQLKADKAIASEKFLAEYQMHSGLKMTKEQLFKKLNNMKGAIKTKTDAKKTGNKPINLTDWEEEFLNLVDSEKNPTFSQVPGSLSVGLPRKRPAIMLTKVEVDVHEPTQGSLASTSSRPTPPPPPKKSRTPAKLPETEETKDMTNAELQRLVLLEQLKLIRLKQEKISQ